MDFRPQIYNYGPRSTFKFSRNLLVQPVQTVDGRRLAKPRTGLRRTSIFEKTWYTRGTAGTGQHKFVPGPW